MPSTTKPGLTAKKTKISAAKLLGKEEGGALGKVGQGSDKSGALPRIVRNNKVKINDVEKRVDANSFKISRLKNITKLRKENVDKKMDGGGELKGILGEIASSMDGIKQTLIDQNKLDQKAAADERKANEKKKRSLKESAIEGIKGSLKKAGEGLLKPFTSMWDTIWTF